MFRINFSYLKCLSKSDSYSMVSSTSIFSFLFPQVTFDKQVMSRSVALAGDVFDPSGTLTGGARPKTSSILTKLEELFDCEQLLQEKEGELKQVVSQLQEIQKVAAK